MFDAKQYAKENSDTQVITGVITDANQGAVAAFAAIASLASAITAARAEGLIDQKALNFIILRSAQYGNDMLNDVPVEVEIETRLADLVNIFAKFI